MDFKQTIYVLRKAVYRNVRKKETPSLKLSNIQHNLQLMSMQPLRAACVARSKIFILAIEYWKE